MGSGSKRAIPQARFSLHPANEIGRTINALKNVRAVATRSDKHAYVFQGSAIAAALWFWLRG